MWVNSPFLLHMEVAIDACCVYTQAYHRDLLEHMPPPAPKVVSNLRRIRAPIPVPVSVRVNSPVRYSAKKNPVRRKGERRPRSRRHPKNPSNRDNTFF
ncbi:hypothetical protein Tco_1100500 [Tanacetum coccineum]